MNFKLVNIYFLNAYIYIISYFTKPGGVLKGVINLKGAVVRAVTYESLSDNMIANNRIFCVQVQPGVDMGSVDPDVIDLAKRMLTNLQKLTCLQKLKISFKHQNSIACWKVLEVIDQLKIRSQINKKLISKVEKLILQESLFTLKQNLRIALNEGHKTSISDLLAESRELKVDPNYPVVARAMLLEHRSECELLLLRSRSLLSTRTSHISDPAHVNPDKMVDSIVSSLSQVEVSRFSSREMKLLVATIIQKAGYNLLKQITSGEYLSLAVRIIKAALGKCYVYNIDTDALQLSKLIVAIVEIDGVLSDEMFNHSHSNLLSTMKNIVSGMYFEDLDNPHSYAYQPAFAIEKYPMLRHIRRKTLEDKKYIYIYIYIFFFF